MTFMDYADKHPWACLFLFLFTQLTIVSMWKDFCNAIAARKWSKDEGQ